MTETISVRLIPRAADALHWLVFKTGFNKSEVVNRALQMYRYISERAADGDVVLIRHPDGTLEQVRFP